MHKRRKYIWIFQASILCLLLCFSSARAEEGSGWGNSEATESADFVMTNSAQEDDMAARVDKIAEYMEEAEAKLKVRVVGYLQKAKEALENDRFDSARSYVRRAARTREDGYKTIEKEARRLAEEEVRVLMGIKEAKTPFGIRKPESVRSYKGTELEVEEEKQRAEKLLSQIDNAEAVYEEEQEDLKKKEETRKRQAEKKAKKKVRLRKEREEESRLRSKKEDKMKRQAEKISYYTRKAQEELDKNNFDKARMYTGKALAVKEKAKKDIQKEGKKYEDIDRYLGRARKYLEDNEFDKARNYTQKALRIDKENDEALDFDSDIDQFEEIYIKELERLTREDRLYEEKKKREEKILAKEEKEDKQDREKEALEKKRREKEAAKKVERELKKQAAAREFGKIKAQKRREERELEEEKNIQKKVKVLAGYIETARKELGNNEFDEARYFIERAFDVDSDSPEAQRLLEQYEFFDENGDRLADINDVSETAFYYIDQAEKVYEGELGRLTREEELTSKRQREIEKAEREATRKKAKAEETRAKEEAEEKAHREKVERIRAEKEAKEAEHKAEIEAKRAKEEAETKARKEKRERIHAKRESEKEIARQAREEKAALKRAEIEARENARKEKIQKLREEKEAKKQAAIDAKEGARKKKLAEEKARKKAKEDLKAKIRAEKEQKEKLRKAKIEKLRAEKKAKEDARKVKIEAKRAEMEAREKIRKEKIQKLREEKEAAKQARESKKRDEVEAKEKAREEKAQKIQAEKAAKKQAAKKVKEEAKRKKQEEIKAEERARNQKSEIRRQKAGGRVQKSPLDFARDREVRKQEVEKTKKTKKIKEKKKKKPKKSLKRVTPEEKSARLKEKKVKDYLTKSRQKFNSDNFKAARSYVKKALKIDDKSPEARELLMVIGQAEGMYRKDFSRSVEEKEKRRQADLALKEQDKKEKRKKKLEEKAKKYISKSKEYLSKGDYDNAKRYAYFAKELTTEDGEIADLITDINKGEMFETRKEKERTREETIKKALKETEESDPMHDYDEGKGWDGKISELAERISGKKTYELKDVQKDRVYTIDECVQLALKRSQRKIVSDKQVKLAEMRLWEVRREIMPEITGRIERSSGKISAGGDMRHYQGEKYAVDLKQNLLDGMGKWFEVRQSQTNLEIVKLEKKKIENEITKDTKIAYYNFDKATKALDIQSKFRKDVNSLYDVTEKIHEEDLIPRVEYLKVKGQNMQANFQYTSAQENVNLAEMILFQAINMEPDQSIGIVPLEKPKDTLSIGLKNCQGLALANKPELKIKEKMIEYYKFDRKIMKAKGWPKIDFQGSFGQSYETFQPTNPGDDEERGLDSEWFAGVKASVPVWGSTVEYNYVREKWTPVVSSTKGTESATSYFSVGLLDDMAYFSNLQEARIGFESAKYEYTKAKKDLAVEVKESYFQYKKSILQIDVTRAQVEHQEMFVDVLEERRLFGEMEASRIIEEYEKLAEYKYGSVQGDTDYFLALTKLSSAIGVPGYFKPAQENKEYEEWLGAGQE